MSDISQPFVLAVGEPPFQIIVVSAGFDLCRSYSAVELCSRNSILLKRAGLTFAFVLYTPSGTPSALLTIHHKSQQLPKYFARLSY
jgi:hypothetical protein